MLEGPGLPSTLPLFSLLPRSLVSSVEEWEQCAKSSFKSPDSIASEELEFLSLVRPNDGRCSLSLFAHFPSSVLCSEASALVSSFLSSLERMGIGVGKDIVGSGGGALSTEVGVSWPAETYCTSGDLVLKVTLRRVEDLALRGGEASWAAASVCGVPVGGWNKVKGVTQVRGEVCHDVGWRESEVKLVMYKDDEGRWWV